MTKLETFLRKKRVWTKFKKNTVKQRGQQYLDHLLDGSIADDYPLHAAFLWHDTPEGEEFWEALAQQHDTILTPIK